MKYQVYDFQDLYLGKTRYVTVLVSEDSAKTFPADKSNADYVQFLEQANLTEKQVQAAKTDTWITL